MVRSPPNLEDFYLARMLWFSHQAEENAHRIYCARAARAPKKARRSQQGGLRPPKSTFHLGKNRPRKPPFSPKNNWVGAIRASPRGEKIWKSGPENRRFLRGIEPPRASPGAPFPATFGLPGGRGGLAGRRAGLPGSLPGGRGGLAARPPPPPLKRCGKWCGHHRTWRTST